MDTPSQFAGLLITNPDGAVEYACGIGTKPNVAAICKDPDWRAAALTRGLVNIREGDVTYLAICLQVSEALVLVFSNSPGDAVDFAYDIVNQLINDPFDAMTVVDADARIAFISPIHESFFGLKRGEAIGQPVSDVIKNTGLDRVVRTGKAEIGEIQIMRGGSRVVTRTPILRDNIPVGAIGRVMFKGPQEVEALNRRVSDLETEVAFYRREADALRGRTFGIDEIIGDSDPMHRLKTDGGTGFRHHQACDGLQAVLDARVGQSFR